MYNIVKASENKNRTGSK